MKRIAGIAVSLAALVLVLVSSGCGGTSSAANEGGSSGGKLTLVAYSTPQEAYEEIIPAFQKTAEGKGVEFEQSYGASGEQSRAVEAGLPADVVEFSLESDITRLVDAGLVDSSWNQNSYKGMVTDSVVVFLVRKGNPQHIETWDDLVKPGVKVITPNPASSGSAKWNILAAWAHAREAQGGTDASAKAFVGKLLHNTVALPGSGSDALASFLAGNGDVLLAYENDSIEAKAAGDDVDYVVPKDTLLIENPDAART